MGYLSIDNLYKDQRVLMFKRIYALEKIHGSSAHVAWGPERGLKLFAGGGSHEEFTALMPGGLAERFEQKIGKPVIVYGEFYGGVDGKGQGMCETYGRAPKFVAFDVCIGEVWLDVPKAATLCEALGFEFVHFDLIEATQEACDAARDADSVQAVRNGMGPGRMREGVVLRPLIELRMNNGGRVIAKHRRPEFSERAGREPRVFDPEVDKVLTDAEEVAEEWVVPMRLRHVLDKLSPAAASLRDIPRVIAAMTEDVLREAEGEIVPSREVEKAIARKAVELFQEWLSPQRP